MSKRERVLVDWLVEKHSFEPEDATETAKDILALLQPEGERVAQNVRAEFSGLAVGKDGELWTVCPDCPVWDHPPVPPSQPEGEPKTVAHVGGDSNPAIRAKEIAERLQPDGERVPDAMTHASHWKLLLDRGELTVRPYDPAKMQEGDGPPWPVWIGSPPPSQEGTYTGNADDVVPNRPLQPSRERDGGPWEDPGIPPGMGRKLNDAMKEPAPIEEIRKRALECGSLGKTWTHHRVYQCFEDRATLLAEIDRLHGEFLSLSENNEYLRAEIAKLREILTDPEIMSPSSLKRATQALEDK